MKNIALPIVFASFLLTACGGGGDSSPSSTSTVTSKPYPYSSFNFESTNGNITKLQRFDVVVAGGTLYFKTPTAIIGTASQQYRTSYYANSNFFFSSRPTLTSRGTAVGFVSDITDSELTLTPYNTSNARDLSTKETYEVVSLAGKTNSAALLNVLHLFSGTANLVWPAGAACRYLKSTNVTTVGSDDGYIKFDASSQSKTSFSTLDQWQSNIESQPNVVIDSSRTRNAVIGGSNASIPIRLLLDTTNQKSYLAAQYGNTVYNALLFQEGVTTKPTSVRNECEDYNQIAADFIKSTVNNFKK